MELLFLTSFEMPDLLPYDQETIKRLSEQSTAVDILDWEKVIYTDPAKLSRYKAILIRTIWNYYKKPESFIEMLDFCEENNLPLLNPVDIVRWNMDKRYLQELQNDGIELIPTEFIFNHHKNVFQKALKRGWQKMVLKPMISGGSYHTFVITDQEENQFNELMAEFYQNRPYLLQEFIPEIANGEISTLCFANGYSYSIKKVPQAGDYRVQFNYGGQYHVCPVDPQIQAIAQQIQERFNSTTLYQRVDGVWKDGHFLLMEVELIEPDLYLGHHEEALNEWVKNLMVL
ncbi:MAG: hypothetical protein WC341_17850 [Bacteroidales bacterium]|jgi:glutathione synthase/RimK-type ligase-like ATP-grasp enzyme